MLVTQCFAGREFKKRPSKKKRKHLFSILLAVFFGCNFWACNDDAGESRSVATYPDTDENENNQDTDTGLDTGGDSSGKPVWDEPGNNQLELDSEVDSCDTENEVSFYLSADDSNSMASPVLVRSLIGAGVLVAPSLVRVHEFLNYYTFSYPPDESGGVRVFSEMQENPEVPGRYDLQLAVRAPDVDSSNRPPLNLTLSIDTSGSMKGYPMELAKESCRAIADSLLAGDIISMVSWDVSENILLKPWVVDEPGDQQVKIMCDNLSAAGATDLYAGLTAAYDLAYENFSRQGVNRVILISDGKANAGLVDADLIARNAVRAEDVSIFLMGVGVGTGVDYHDTLMNIVTDAGKGSYIFVDSTEEALNAFGQSFLSNVGVAALDVRVKLTLPPSFEMVAFHGEEHSVNSEDIEPQHLALNDAMIFHMSVASCDDAGVSKEEDKVVVRVEYKDPLTGELEWSEVSATLQELVDQDNTGLVKGNAVVVYAEAIKQLGNLEGQEALDLIDRVQDQVQAAADLLGGDAELDEINSLLTMYSKNF